MNAEAKQVRNSQFGLIALILGMLALAGAVGHFWLGPIDSPPALEDTIADQAVKIRDKVVARLKGIDTPPATAMSSPWDWDRIALASIAGVSVLSILLAVIAYVRHEPLRVAGSAVFLGTFALALQYLVIAVGAIVFAIIIAAVLGGLGLS